MVVWFVVVGLFAIVPLAREAVQVALGIGILLVEALESAVGLVLGVESASHLPTVGHCIAIAIDRGNGRGNYGPTAHIHL